MGKRGRPPKEGERYPGGKLKHEPKPEFLREISPTEVRRIGDHGHDLGADRRLAGEIGRLLLTRQISTMEAAAAWRVADIYGRFEFYSGRRRNTASPSYEMGARSTGEDRDRGEAERAAHDAWDDLQAFVEARWPMRPFTSPKVAPDLWRWPRSNRVRDLLEKLCVDDRCIGPAALYEIRAVLHRLAVEHFEIVSAPKKEKRAAPPLSTDIRQQLRTSDFGRDLQVLFETAATSAEAWPAEIAKDASERISEVRDFFVALREREKFNVEKKRAKSRASADD